MVDAKLDAVAEAEFATVTGFVGSARTIRSEHDVPKSQLVDIHWHTEDAEKKATLERERTTIEALARCTMHFEPDTAKFDNANDHFDNAAVFSNPGIRAVVPNVIDTDKERDRLQRELKKVEKDLTTVEKKLSNPSFVDRAPAKVVAKSKQDAQELKEKRDQLQSALTRL